jgi:outer membrane receptor protein involved in Fe transport
MKELEFNKWWREFMHNHEKDSDNGIRLFNELKWTLNGFNKKARYSFINALIENKKLTVAAYLIPMYGSILQKIHLRVIFLKKLFNKRQFEFDIQFETQELLISIIKTYKPTDYVFVNLYFIVSKDFNSPVLQELYYHNKVLFLKFFNRSIGKLKAKSYSLTVFFRNSDIKDFLMKKGDRKILHKIQLLDESLNLM